MSTNFNWYKEGTISLDIGSKNVTGTSTQFSTYGIVPGDILVLGKAIYEIAVVNSDTSITLEKDYAGGANLTDANYAIIHSFNSTDNSKFVAKTNELLKLVETNSIEIPENTLTDLDTTLLSESTTLGVAASMGKRLNNNKASKTNVGTLSNLTTNAKSNLVAAINEVYPKIGDLSALSTANKDSLVSSINSFLANAAIGVDLSDVSGAGFHNSIYRGISLGNALTEDQSTNIANGTFDGMFIGDYWTINDIIWRIAHFDYYYGFGDTPCLTHHVTVVPDTILYKQRMNATNIITDGYLGSEMRASGLNNAKTTCDNAFGSDHILTHRNFFSNAANGNFASGGAWADSTVDLMCQTQVYGSHIVGEYRNAPIQYDGLIDYNQFKLFEYNPAKIISKFNNEYWYYWLRDLADSYYFANVDYNGNANCSSASGSDNGVRVALSII